MTANRPPRLEDEFPRAYELFQTWCALPAHEVDRRGADPATAAALGIDTQYMRNLRRKYRWKERRPPAPEPTPDPIPPGTIATSTPAVTGTIIPAQPPHSPQATTAAEASWASTFVSSAERIGRASPAASQIVADYFQAVSKGEEIRSELQSGAYLALKHFFPQGLVERALDQAELSGDCTTPGGCTAARSQHLYAMTNHLDQPALPTRAHAQALRTLADQIDSYLDLTDTTP